MIKKQAKKTYFPRYLLKQLKKWLDRKEIFAIKGPRQAGKTTLLQMLKDYLIEEKQVEPQDVIFITFEDRDILEKFAKDPKTYVNNYLLQKKGSRLYFLIDEYHYLKEGGQKIKLLYDLFANQVKFIITGSSSLELTGQTGKYLVGRIFSFFLWPLTFLEFLKVKTDFVPSYEIINKKVHQFLIDGIDFKMDGKKDIWQKDLEKLFEEYALWGGYPEVVKAKDQETKYIVLKNIYDTYIRRDIIELLRLKSVENYQNVVKLLASEIGNLVNYENLTSDSRTYFQELKHYMSILEETFIVKLLTPYFKNPVTELKKNPKTYFYDLGLRNYIIDNFNPIYARTDKGTLIENSVFCQLYKKLPSEKIIKFWRTIAKAEVDFLVLSGQELIPIEVKYAVFEKPKISRSFRSFIGQYHPKRGIVLTKGYWADIKIESTIIKFIPVWYI